MTVGREEAPLPTERPLKERLADLVAGACDGAVAPAEILAEDYTLSALGITSLAQLRLIDAIEQEFGVDLELGEDMVFLDSLDGMATYLAARGVQAPP